MIVSNPPYISSEDLKCLPREVQAEPKGALDGGENGLDALQKIASEAPFYLKPGGWLLMEIGDGQSEKISRILRTHKAYKNLKFAKDHNGIERVLIAQHG